MILAGCARKAKHQVFFPSCSLVLFTAAGVMAEPRARGVALRLYDGRVLVAGGEAASPSSGSVQYDPDANSWSSAGATYTATMSVMATLPSGDVLRSGGFASDAVTTAMVFPPATDTWTEIADGPTAPQSAVLLRDGRLLLTGILDSYLFR